jgi:ribosomal protein S18 acetylase RimI-like enzyme
MSHVPLSEAPRERLRRATPEDAPALAALRYTFRTLDYPGRGSAFEERDVFVARCAAWMAERLTERAGGGWRCWLIEVGERGDPNAIVGQLWLQAIEKIPNPVAEPELHAYVSNVYVLPELRGRGLAGRLLDLALAWCREHRVDQVILWPSEKSRPLYARHGFAASAGVLVAAID